jgi:hypothetical protein
MEKNKLGWSYSAYWRRGDAYRVLVGKPEERDHLGDPSVDGWINIEMDLQDVGCGGLDWIELNQNRDRWRALATAVILINLRVP